MGSDTTEYAPSGVLECAVCGEDVHYLICNVCKNCGWEEDTLQETDHNADRGANWMSLNRAKENYAKYGNKWSPEDKREMEDYYAAKNKRV